jgi:phosphoribosyl 1,2-cyclic phosphodiesterase
MMRVKLFGTRGSVAAPGADTARYGGNTSSIEVHEDDGTVLVLDAGTGIRQLGAQIRPDLARIDILLTHLHMDHIQGLGFFAPLYNPGIDVHVWGPGSSTLSLAARLSRYLSPPLFPVHLRDLPRVSCHHVPCPAFEVGPFRIHSALVCHPGPTVGYRIESPSGTLAYLPDHEPALGLRDGCWLKPDWTSGFELAAGADLLIHDAQYTDEEYEQRIGWGHSTYRQLCEFAARTGAKRLVPFHHDPSHDDEMLDRLIETAKLATHPTFEVSAGYEGAVFEVGSQSRPGPPSGG